MMFDALEPTFRRLVLDYYVGIFRYHEYGILRAYGGTGTSLLVISDQELRPRHADVLLPP